LIHYGRGKITVLDRPKLEARVCECYAVVKREYGRLLPLITATWGVAIRRDDQHGPQPPWSLHADSIRGLRQPALPRAGDFDYHAAIRLQAGDQFLGCFRAFAFTRLGHGI